MDPYCSYIFDLGQFLLEKDILHVYLLDRFTTFWQWLQICGDVMLSKHKLLNCVGGQQTISTRSSFKLNYYIVQL